MIYIPTYIDSTLLVIDPYVNKVVTRIPLGKTPGLNGIDINYVTNVIYVINSINDTVTVIDGFHNNVIKNIRVGYYPEAVLVKHYGFVIDRISNSHYQQNHPDGRRITVPKT